MNRDPHEQDLLEHYRRHSEEQPSAQLDARILAAARAAAAERKSSAPQRLYHWLLGAAGRQRWGVAVAGLATLGIGLSLTLRTYQEAPERFDAPVSPAMLRAPAPAPAMAPPAAPAAAPYAAPSMAAPQMDSAAGAAMEELAKPAPMSRKMAVDSAQAEPLAEARELHDAQAQPGRQVQGKLQALAVRGDEPRTSLLHLRDLQDKGQKEEAERVRESLRQRFPELDIDKALKELSDNP
ncbi:hypothetical protein [Pseudomonas pseudonitroreducens]|uniref:hypothetical protein n=1 Tax=Pseudomonas pseudonitroreducens TaxID=2892326 RepID=UPI001F244A1F|nr:hypothetical protein [Pseudomonas pseudonitroreducens]